MELSANIYQFWRLVTVTVASKQHINAVVWFQCLILALTNIFSICYVPVSKVHEDVTMELGNVKSVCITKYV
jgi:hypothetical protein